MSSLSDTTSDIRLDDPAQWTLSLHLDDRQISFMLHADRVHDSLICRTIDLAEWRNDDEYLKAVENAIYDNSLLLSDFKRVNVSVDSQQFLFLPPDYGTDGDARQAFDVAFPSARGDFAVSRGHNCRADVAFMLRPGVYQFLRRAFSNIPVRLHQEVLCSYFRGKADTSDISKISAFLRNGRIDVCAFSRGRLQMANSYNTRSTGDAAYFILAAWNMLKLDPQADEIQLAGDKQMRAAIMPTLRQYVTYVIPAMMPQGAMRLATDVAKAPFNLTILAL